MKTLEKSQHKAGRCSSPLSCSEVPFEARVREAQHLVRRNLPGWPSTFGECDRKCGSGLLGRGGGPCLRCAADDLGALVGKDAAERYVDAVRTARKTKKPSALASLTIDSARGRGGTSGTKISASKCDWKMTEAYSCPPKRGTSPRSESPQSQSNNSTR